MINSKRPFIFSILLSIGLLDTNSYFSVENLQKSWLQHTSYCISIYPLGLNLQDYFSHTVASIMRISVSRRMTGPNINPVSNSLCLILYTILESCKIDLIIYLLKSSPVIHLPSFHIFLTFITLFANLA